MPPTTMYITHYYDNRKCDCAKELEKGVQKIMDALEALKQEVADLTQADDNLKSAVAEVAAAIQTKLAAKDAIIDTLKAQLSGSVPASEIAATTAQFDAATKDIETTVDVLRNLGASTPAPVDPAPPTAPATPPGDPGTPPPS